MKLSIGIILAAAYGLIVRLIFGLATEVLEIMSISFLFLLPFLIGFLTVIFLKVDIVRNATRAFFLPWITTFILLTITIAVSIEGIICWIMVYPFFSSMAGVGGIIGNKIKLRYLNKNNNSLNLSVLALLPLFIGYVERDAGSSTTRYSRTRSVIINATPDLVWQKLTNINHIKANENNSYLTNVIGFPRHVSTIIDTVAVGGHRKALYEKGLYFDEIISHCKLGERLTVAIKTDPGKIPANVLDEHVVIGGKHINILEDTYTLKRMPNNKCQLELTSNFSISTPFNWYAKLWATLVIDNVLMGELDLIKARADVRKTAFDTAEAK